MVVHRTEAVPAAPGGTVPVVAAGVFEGPLRELVVSLKYSHRRNVAHQLAVMLAPLVPSTVDVVTWAPTSDAHRTARGFDHAELIARHAASLAGVRWAALLRREDAAGQTGRSRSDRLGAPRFRASSRSRGLHVLVVDDVVTTGATVRAAAQALLSAGSARVTGLCVASVGTP